MPDSEAVPTFKLIMPARVGGGDLSHFSHRDCISRVLCWTCSSSRCSMGHSRSELFSARNLIFTFAQGVSWIRIKRADSPAAACVTAADKEEKYRSQSVRSVEEWIFDAQIKELCGKRALDVAMNRQHARRR